MARTSKVRREQLKTSAEASSKEMGDIFNDMSKRIGVAFKGEATKAGKAWSEAARG